MTMNQNEVMIYKDKLEKDAKNNTWKHRTDQILSNLDRK